MQQSHLKTFLLKLDEKKTGTDSLDLIISKKKNGHLAEFFLGRELENWVVMHTLKCMNISYIQSML